MKYLLFDSFLEKILQLATLNHSSSKVAKSIDLDLKKILSYSNIKKSLRLTFFSVDVLNDYEIAQVASFDPKLLDRDKLYVFQQSVGISKSFKFVGIISRMIEIKLARKPGQC